MGAVRTGLVALGFAGNRSDETAWLGQDTHAYIHYLHHKHFEVVYGDGLVHFDKWFGTFHDGSAAHVA